ncbi:thiamine phosphate synthase [Trinickia caryophylli]|nr:thiamine phosphate synthase [Trinickia caryophylli]
MITPEPPADELRFGDFLDRLDAALVRGIELVQLRAKTLDAASYGRLARQALLRCRAHGALMVLNGPSTDEPPEADGIHLTSERLMRASARPVSDSMLFSAACHTRAQLAHAAAIGADLVTLSPVLPTSSHPGEPTLGWRRFAQLVAGVRVPIYALGGMGREDERLARAFGARGIAGISAFW